MDVVDGLGRKLITGCGAAILLAVPSGETDHFPDQTIDWVLFTAIDANEHVVDVGGGLI